MSSKIGGKRLSSSKKQSSSKTSRKDETHQHPKASVVLIANETDPAAASPSGTVGGSYGSKHYHVGFTALFVVFLLTVSFVSGPRGEAAARHALKQRHIEVREGGGENVWGAEKTSPRKENNEPRELKKERESRPPAFELTRHVANNLATPAFSSSPTSRQPTSKDKEVAADDNAKREDGPVSVPSGGREVSIGGQLSEEHDDNPKRSILEVFNTSLLALNFPRGQPSPLVAVAIIDVRQAKGPQHELQQHNTSEIASVARLDVDEPKALLLANFPVLPHTITPMTSDSVRLGSSPIAGVVLVSEAFLGRDVCVSKSSITSELNSLDTGATDTATGGAGSSGEGHGSGSDTSLPPLWMLSENPSTARLLSRLPANAQRAIASQNAYYWYLRDEVFELNTRTGAWRVKPDIGKDIDEGEAVAAGELVDYRERGILKGNWASFLRQERLNVNEAHDAVRTGDSGNNTDNNGDAVKPLKRSVVVSKVINKNGGTTESGIDEITGKVIHWEDSAALETSWPSSPSPPLTLLESELTDNKPIATNSGEHSTVNRRQGTNGGGFDVSENLYSLKTNTGLCPQSRAVPLPITTPLLAERFANKRLLFLGDSMIRNTFVMTIAKLCNYANSAKCMARMPTYEYDIDKKNSWEKGPIGCVPKFGQAYARRNHKKPSDTKKRAEGNEGEKQHVAEAGVNKNAEKNHDDVASDSNIADLVGKALDEALHFLQGTDRLTADERVEAADKILEEALSTLSPCYRHAQFFFLPIKKLTVKIMSKDPNARRQLSKGDLIPPTINVYFPQLNLTMIYLSVVKPKMIWAVANHIGFLNSFSTRDSASVLKGESGAMSSRVASYIPVRYFGKKGSGNASSLFSLAGNSGGASVSNTEVRGFDTPTPGPRHGFLSFLDGIFVSIGPHLKYPDLVSSAYSYPDALAHLKAKTNNAPMVVAEYTHVLRTGVAFSNLIDKVSEAIRIRLALMRPDPPLFIPQRFVTQFMFRLRDAGNTTHEDASRPRNTYFVRNTVFSSRGGEPLYGPTFGSSRSPSEESAAGTAADFVENNQEKVDESVSDKRNPRSSGEGDHILDDDFRPIPNNPNARRTYSRRFFSSEVDGEGGGSLTGIAGCGYYDNQHPALRCHNVLSELILAGMLTKLANRDAALDEIVQTVLRQRSSSQPQP